MIVQNYKKVAILLLSLISQVISKEGDETSATYDYIVVGGGSGGGMVAMRLAKFGFSTLLLESGPEPSITSSNLTIPNFSLRASEDPNLSYNYNVKHFPEKSRLRQNVMYPRGGSLGGTSNIHNMIAIYPQQRDFDQLYLLTGNPVFVEKTFRERYFKPLEKCYYPLLTGKTDHGYEGWYPTSYSTLHRMLSSDKGLSKFINTLAGDPKFDVNGYVGSKLGTDVPGMFNIPNAVHQTNFTRMNYLNQILFAKKLFPLTIMTDSLVTQIIFDQTKAARGVKVSHGANLYRASANYKDENWIKSKKNMYFARKEVILSAGAFNTPQLLMLSGIGDRQQLQDMNIEVIHHLPGVGANLQDRYEIPYAVKLPEPLSLYNGCHVVADSNDTCYKYYKNKKTGPYIANSGISGLTLKSKQKLTEPDLFVLNAPINFYGYFPNYSEIAATVLDTFSQIILKTRTSSRGYVKLQSNDPRDIPDINFNKFGGSTEDLQSLIYAIQYLRNQTFSNLGESFEELLPGPNVKSKQQLAKWITSMAWGHHACCTAKVGLDNDPNAVLDGRFRVRGVKRLRVVDASIFNEIPGYFPNFLIHMMGDLVADFIYEEHFNREPSYPIPPPEFAGNDPFANESETDFGVGTDPFDVKIPDEDPFANLGDEDPFANLDSNSEDG